MEDYQALITPISTLFGVGITLLFTRQREKTKFIQEVKVKEYDELKMFYAQSISSLELVIRYAERMEDYDSLLSELSLISAKMSLLASEEISNQFHEVSADVKNWSKFYRLGGPKKLGDTGLGMVSSNDKKYREIAEKEFPAIRQDILALSELMKQDLARKNKKLRK